MEYSTDEKRMIMEYIEDSDDCPESFMNYYVEERRREYSEEWLEFLEALDKE